MNNNTSELILRDEQGYFFMQMRRWTGPRRYGRSVATVHTERGMIAVVDEKLAHFVEQERTEYTIDELMERVDNPPEGLRIELEPDE